MSLFRIEKSKTAPGYKVLKIFHQQVSEVPSKTQKIIIIKTARFFRKEILVREEHQTTITYKPAMCLTTPILASICQHVLYFNLSMPCTRRFTTSHQLSDIQRGVPRLSNRFRYCIDCFVQQQPRSSDLLRLFARFCLCLFTAFGLSAVEGIAAWHCMWENLYRTFEDSNEGEVCSI